MLAIALGILLGIVHFFGENIHIKYPISKIKLLSFAAGFSITYIFLYLFPELFAEAETNRIVFLFMLMGFAVFYITEMHIFVHKNQKTARHELKELHSAAFFLYHFLIGVVIVNLLAVSLSYAMLFLIPIFFHTAISSVSMAEIHEKVKERLPLKATLSVSSLLGVEFAYLVQMPAVVQNSLFGFVVGTLLYIVIRDALPKHKENKPRFFIAGIAVSAALIMLTWGYGI